MGGDGEIEAGSGTDERARELADAGRELLVAAASVRPGVEVEHVSVALPNGSVVVARAAGRAVVATTVPEPALALVLYDLRAALVRTGDTVARSTTRRRKAAD